MSTAAVIPMLKGDALVAHQNEYMPLIIRGEKTRTDMILDAGYVYDNGKAMYTQYYTELLNAKGIQPATNNDVADAEYDALDSDKRELYDAIDAKLGSKWTHEEIIEFIDELDDIGITDATAFEDTFEWEHDSYSSYAEKEFAEYFVIEVMCAQIPDIALYAVDWQHVWDHDLRYDYNTIETANGTYFFRNN